MIEEIFWMILQGLLLALIFILPAYAMPDPLSLGVMQAADFVLPLSEIPVYFTLAAAFAIASLVYFSGNWLIKRFTMSG